MECHLAQGSQGLAAASFVDLCAQSVLLCLTGLAEDFLKDYIQVRIGSLDLRVSHNITQIVEVCEDYQKYRKYVGASWVPPLW